MPRLNLIISNKPSQLNKKIIKFFDRNLLNLNKAGLVFEFEVASLAKIKTYKNRGVTNYPVLITEDDEHVIGVEKIISVLKEMVMDFNRKLQSKQQSKTTDDEVEDFWSDVLGNPTVNDAGQIETKSDSDDESDDNSDMQRKLNEAYESRNTELKSTSKAKNNAVRSVKGTTSRPQEKSSLSETPRETMQKMKKSGDGGLDDELMANFFENQGLG